MLLRGMGLLLLLLLGEVAALIAVPVSCAVQSIFDAVSEIADTFTECSVTECELGVQVVALVRWQIDVDENASLEVCECRRCCRGVKCEQTSALFGCGGESPLFFEAWDWGPGGGIPAEVPRSSHQCDDFFRAWRHGCWC